ncbi:sensor histidine kinase [Paenisporosarcina sp. TG20]|uniref:sensor histidine kinase n=1 Tax=Paenisporosarcina sp. TG20 TaxID=1211706 RepID=UPI0002E53CEF|nr:sensor histidine kinase [Paenisporosarcina sp. TG20]
MQSWYQIFPKNPYVSIYIWIIFCILPLFYIFNSFSPAESFLGLLLVLAFFLTYRQSFISKGWRMYVWIASQIIISITLIILFGYLYFSLFLAFFIGNIRNKAGFITMYVVHLVTTMISVSIGFFTQSDLFVSQFPFILIGIIGVILLPFNSYVRNKQENLENQLEDANKQISRLVIMQERQRIARDLHDTLGQKLSLIGLKSDLASKLIEKDPVRAKTELRDINHTARIALKEVRELVSNMQSGKLEDELIRVQQILKAADIDFRVKGNPVLKDTPLLVENVLSMCLKEAITNVVKHSKATFCHVLIKQTQNDLFLQVQDNGIGFDPDRQFLEGHGLRGMRERLEFVNGELEISEVEGTTINVHIPHVILQSVKED